MKRPSLKLRITAWFALMMFVIEALVLAFLLAVNGTVATNDPEARLVRMVEHNADRVKYNHRQFRYGRIHYNRSGVYTVLYDADGNVLQGTFPAEFTPSEPLPLGGETVRLVDCGENEYYVYDVHVDMMVGSVWLRGVIDADANGGVMRALRSCPSEMALAAAVSWRTGRRARLAMKYPPMTDSTSSTGSRIPGRLPGTGRPVPGSNPVMFCSSRKDIPAAPRQRVRRDFLSHCFIAMILSKTAADP